MGKPEPSAELDKELDKILWVPGIGQENMYKALRTQIVALIDKQTNLAIDNIIAIGTERLENDDFYTLGAFLEDIAEYNNRLKKGNQYR